MTAKDLAVKLKKLIGWKKTTTYTIIGRCVEKGLIKRFNNDYTCVPLITREEAQRHESNILVDKMFDGSEDKLIAFLLGSSKITKLQIDHLRKFVQEFS